MSSLTSAARIAEQLKSSGHAIYLGRDVVGPIFATTEDHLLVIGPPRSGKTSRILTPSAAVHPGPVIAISTRPDLLRDTLDARRRVAETFGGDVRQLSLSGSHLELDEPTVRWELPDGCDRWEVARDRAASMVTCAVPPSNGDTVWRDSAMTALAGCLHGAALLGHTGAHMASKIRTANIAQYQEVVQSLDPSGTHPSTQAFAWLHDDRVIAENTRRSVFFVLSQQVLGAFDYLAADAPAISAKTIVKSGAPTIYLTIPYERRLQSAPLVTAFVEAVVAEWRAQHRQNMRVDGTTLLLVLDEAANISPLPSLPGLLTSGAGDNIQVIFALQEPSQTSAWHAEADAVLNGSRLLALFPGLRDQAFLAQLANLAHHEIAHDINVTVSEAWLGGERYATAERLIRERRRLEQEILGHPSNQHHRIRLRAVQELVRRRREDMIRTGDDDTANPFSVLDEIMTFTEVTVLPERRSTLEVSDLTGGSPDSVGLFAGSSYQRLSATHWRRDPFWRQFLTAE